MVLGLAGRMGAGKNFVASLLEERGFRCLDLDDVAHQVLNALASRVVAAFGPEIMTGDGSIDRERLAQRVFGDAAALKLLESITYPNIEKEALEWLDRNSGVPTAIHAVNLHKTELPKQCDAVLWIQASLRLRRARIVRRDGVPFKALKRRFRSQDSLDPKLFSFLAETYIVKNNGTRASLDRRLDKILSHLNFRKQS